MALAARLGETQRPPTADERQTLRQPHRVLYFHQVDDPYSALAASCLERFAQRYDVAEAEVTASIAVSTVMALVTLPIVMFLASRFVAS